MTNRAVFFYPFWYIIQYQYLPDNHICAYRQISSYKMLTKRYICSIIYIEV